MAVKTGLSRKREKQRLRVFENGVLGRISRPKRDKIREPAEYCTITSFQRVVLATLLTIYAEG
jgi:hypothetical protein